MSPGAVRPGARWEQPASGPPDLVVAGSDADLAAAVAGRPGALVRFDPDPSSDLARTLGRGGRGVLEVALDALAVRLDDREVLAVNAVVVGTPPDRLRPWSRRRRLRVEADDRALHEGPATSVVVATGQFLRGGDLCPRGHPGDGRVEVQVYDVPPGERAALRDRLRRGAHVPHPRIVERSARRVVVASDGRPVEVDGRALGRARRVRVEVRAGAYRLLL